MKRYLSSLFVVALTLLAISGSAVVARQVAPLPLPPPPPPPTERKPLVPLDVQIVIARYQGEKKVSSLPYALAVNANEPELSRLRMGANVPVPVGQAMKGAPMPWNYRDIGINIDCSARSIEEGRFQLLISVEDSSVYTNAKDAGGLSGDEFPVFRSFKTTNTLVLRDGQTRQFTAATDRVSGEVVKIDVTLRVVK